MQSQQKNSQMKPNKKNNLLKKQKTMDQKVSDQNQQQDDSQIISKISQLIDKKTIDNQVYYQVKWQGYDDYTWEPIDILTDRFQDEINQFELSLQQTNQDDDAQDSDDSGQFITKQQLRQQQIQNKKFDIQEETKYQENRQKKISQESYQEIPNKSQRQTTKQDIQSIEFDKLNQIQAKKGQSILKELENIMGLEKYSPKKIESEKINSLNYSSEKKISQNVSDNDDDIKLQLKLKNQPRTRPKKSQKISDNYEDDPKQKKKTQKISNKPVKVQNISKNKLLPIKKDVSLNEDLMQQLQISQNSDISEDLNPEQYQKIYQQIQDNISDSSQDKSVKATQENDFINNLVNKINQERKVMDNTRKFFSQELSEQIVRQHQKKTANTFSKIIDNSKILNDPLYRYSIQTPEYNDLSDDAFSDNNDKNYNNKNRTRNNSKLINQNRNLPNKNDDDDDDVIFIGSKQTNSKPRIPQMSSDKRYDDRQYRNDQYYDDRNHNRDRYYDRRDDLRFDSRDNHRFDRRNDHKFDRGDDYRYDRREDHRFDSRDDQRFDFRDDHRFDPRYNRQNSNQYDNKYPNQYSSQYLNQYSSQHPNQNIQHPNQYSNQQYSQDLLYQQDRQYPLDNQYSYDRRQQLQHRNDERFYKNNDYRGDFDNNQYYISPQNQQNQYDQTYQNQNYDQRNQELNNNNSQNRYNGNLSHDRNQYHNLSQNEGRGQDQFNSHPQRKLASTPNNSSFKYEQGRFDQNTQNSNHPNVNDWNAQQQNYEDGEMPGEVPPQQYQTPGITYQQQKQNVDQNNPQNWQSQSNNQKQLNPNQNQNNDNINKQWGNDQQSSNYKWTSQNNNQQNYNNQNYQQDQNQNANYQQKQQNSWNTPQLDDQNIWGVTQDINQNNQPKTPSKPKRKEMARIDMKQISLINQRIELVPPKAKMTRLGYLLKQIPANEPILIFTSFSKIADKIKEKFKEYKYQFELKNYPGNESLESENAILVFATKSDTQYNYPDIHLAIHYDCPSAEDYLSMQAVICDQKYKSTVTFVSQAKEIESLSELIKTFQSMDKPVNDIILKFRDSKQLSEEEQNEILSEYFNAQKAEKFHLVPRGGLGNITKQNAIIDKIEIKQMLQRVEVLPQKAKMARLMYLLKQVPENTSILVFCSHWKIVERLQEKVIENYPNCFRLKQFPSTDLIESQNAIVVFGTNRETQSKQSDINLVINYDCPNGEDYMKQLAVVSGPGFKQVITFVAAQRDEENAKQIIEIFKEFNKDIDEFLLRFIDSNGQDDSERDAILDEAFQFQKSEKFYMCPRDMPRREFDPEKVQFNKKYLDKSNNKSVFQKKDDNTGQAGWGNNKQDNASGGWGNNNKQNSTSGWANNNNNQETGGWGANNNNSSSMAQYNKKDQPQNSWGDQPVSDQWANQSNIQQQSDEWGSQPKQQQQEQIDGDTKQQQLQPQQQETDSWNEKSINQQDIDGKAENSLQQKQQQNQFQEQLQLQQNQQNEIDAWGNQSQQLQQQQQDENECWRNESQQLQQQQQDENECWGNQDINQNQQNMQKQNEQYRNEKIQKDEPLPKKKVHLEEDSWGNNQDIEQNQQQEENTWKACDSK